MNFAKNIAKRWKKSQEVKEKRKRIIEERQMNKKAETIASNTTNNKKVEIVGLEVEDGISEDAVTIPEKKEIDIDRKIDISFDKVSETGNNIEENNIFSIKYLPRLGENWKDIAKVANITDEEIAAIEKWNEENKE